jgi:hypothetical protein
MRIEEQDWNDVDVVAVAWGEVRDAFEEAMLDQKIHPKTVGDIVDTVFDSVHIV